MPDLTNQPLPGGSIVTFSAVVPVQDAFTSWGLPTSIIGLGSTNVNGAKYQQLVNDLTASGLIVQGTSSETITASQDATQLNITVLVQNGIGYGSVADFQTEVASLIESDFGAAPVSFAVTQVQVVGNSIPTPTGQAAASLPGAGASNSGSGCQQVCGNPCWSFFDNPVAYIKCTATSGLSTLGLVFIGLALGIVLLVTLQTKKEVGI
jgi:hypothetical protein